MRTGSRWRPGSPLAGLGNPLSRAVRRTERFGRYFRLALTKEPPSARPRAAFRQPDALQLHGRCLGHGGLSDTMQIATKGFPMAVLADGCDGGWMLLAKPSITSFAELAGKKIAVQNGSIGLVSLNWKLQHEGLTDKVELLYLDNQDMPVPLARGDVDAICCFEPYVTFAELNGFGKKLWVPYDTPMGKTNLGFVASIPFIKKEPELTKVLVQAHVKATNTMRDNPKIAIETTIKQFNMSQEVAEASTKNLFFSADSGAGFQDGLKALAGMMLTNKMLDTEPKWDEFINTSFI